MNLRSGKRRRDEATIELTPLIDVVFLLLIFFLLTSSIQQAQQNTSSESAIRIDLPEAQSGSQSIQNDPLILTVTKEGKVVLEGADEIPGNSIEEQLQNLYRERPKAQLLLRGDEGSSYSQVMELLGTVKQLGFKQVDLVIATPQATPP